MREALCEPHTHADQRLLLAIVIAMAVHAMVVLGVRLPAEAPVKARYAALEVMLVPTPAPDATASVATPPTAVAIPHEPPLVLAPLLQKPPIKAATALAPKPTLSKPAASKFAPPTAPTTPALVTPKTAPPATQPLLPSAVQLIERSMAIAASGAGLIEDKTLNGQSLAERTLYITNDTRDFTLVTYKDEVRRKVKDFGQMVEREVPSGHPVLDVRIGIDGALLSATISKSSGIPATDAKAIRIVELAAPFAPIPPELAKKYEALRFDMPLNIEQDAGFSHGQ